MFTGSAASKLNGANGRDLAQREIWRLGFEIHNQLAHREGPRPVMILALL
jgi:hypothetical protein